MNQLAVEASALAMAGKFEASRLKGTMALEIADEAMVRTADLSRSVVSFSLFGSEPGYCECAVLNAKAMPSIYPGWEMWVFHDDSVPGQVLRRLEAEGVQLRSAAACAISHWPGTFWRFKAVTFPNIGRVIFRDADSIIGEREKTLVNEWLTNGKPFHVIRDWYTHVDLILAGLWGAYAPLLENMHGWIDSFLKRSNLHPTHADQHFLAEYVWPRIRDFTLVHDSIHTGRNIVPFAAVPPSPSGRDSLGAYRWKHIEFTAKLSGKYDLILFDEQRRPIFAYERELKDNKDAFELPYKYFDKIEARDWTLEFRQRRTV